MKPFNWLWILLTASVLTTVSIVASDWFQEEAKDESFGAKIYWSILIFIGAFIGRISVAGIGAALVRAADAPASKQTLLRAEVIPKIVTQCHLMYMKEFGQEPSVSARMEWIRNLSGLPDTELDRLSRDASAVNRLYEALKNV